MKAQASASSRVLDQYRHASVLRIDNGNDFHYYLLNSLKTMMGFISTCLAPGGRGAWR
jgi:hypothetical protein